MVSRFVRIEKASGSIPDISIFRNIKELEGLNRKTINLNLLESIEYFYYSNNYSGKKEEKKKDKKELEKLKNLFENYILNLENIISKMNKMILVIFWEYKY